MQDTQLLELFEVNVAFIMNAYLCFARPGMAVSDAADAADMDISCLPLRERERTVALACDEER